MGCVLPVIHVHCVYLVESVATVQLWRLRTRAALLVSGCDGNGDFGAGTGLRGCADCFAWIVAEERGEISGDVVLGGN